VLYPLSYEGLERYPCDGTGRLVPLSLRRTGRCSTNPHRWLFASKRRHRDCRRYLSLALSGQQPAHHVDEL
jgi:hypothetical protein